MLDTSVCISSRQSRVLPISSTTKLFIEASPPSAQISTGTFLITMIFSFSIPEESLQDGKMQIYLPEGRITLTI
jgi:hypothetical protein